MPTYLLFSSIAQMFFNRLANRNNYIKVVRIPSAFAALNSTLKHIVTFTVDDSLTIFIDLKAI